MMEMCIRDSTIIAVLCGFMIFPSLFTFGIEPNAGPTLVFQSLPIVFSHLWAGKFFAIVFFGLLLIAALTTSITIYEVIITALQEKLRMRRGKAIFVTLRGIFLLGKMCIRDRVTTGFAWAHQMITYWRKLVINMTNVSLFSQVDR